MWDATNQETQSWSPMATGKSHMKTTPMLLKSSNGFGSLNIQWSEDLWPLMFVQSRTGQTRAPERRRRGILVGPHSNRMQSPGGAAYSEYIAPTELENLSLGRVLQRCRAYGASGRTSVRQKSALTLTLSPRTGEGTNPVGRRCCAAEIEAKQQLRPTNRQVRMLFK
jgi:hypothetical protein